MKRKRTRRLISLVVAWVCLSAFSACERPTRLKLANNANPPTFELSGSGDLIFLVLFEDRTPSVDGPVMWKIQPAPGRVVDNLPEITYGVVPPGFTQTEPANGSPPPLLEGKTYEIGGPTVGAPGGWTKFTIKDGKTVVIDSGL